MSVSRYQQIYPEPGAQLSCGKTNGCCDGCCVKPCTGNLVESEAHEAFARVPHRFRSGSYLAFGNFRPPSPGTTDALMTPLLVCLAALVPLLAYAYSDSPPVVAWASHRYVSSFER